MSVKPVFVLDHQQGQGFYGRADQAEAFGRCKNGEALSKTSLLKIARKQQIQRVPYYVFYFKGV